MAFISYSGKVTKLKEEGRKIIIHGTLMRSGGLGHNAMLIFENNSKVKHIIKNKKEYLVTFGRHPGGNHFAGNVDKNIEQPKSKSDKVIIPISGSEFLEIIFLDNVTMDDDNLNSYLKLGEQVSVLFL